MYDEGYEEKQALFVRRWALNVAAVLTKDVLSILGIEFKFDKTTPGGIARVTIEIAKELEKYLKEK